MTSSNEPDRVPPDPAQRAQGSSGPVPVMPIEGGTDGKRYTPPVRAVPPPLPVGLPAGVPVVGPGWGGAGSGVASLGYAPPPATDNSVELARAQRQLILTLLAYLASVGILFGAGAIGGRSAALMGIAVVVCVLVVAGICIFRMAWRLWGLAAAIAVTVALPVPFVGMVVLVVLNVLTTVTLKQRGFRVGFFGVSGAQLRARAYVVDR